MKKLSVFLICLFLMHFTVYAETSELDFLKNYFEVIAINVSQSTHVTYVDEGYMIFHNNESYGIKDYDGNIIIEPEFNWIGGFYEDIAPARKLVSARLGYINKKGEYVIPPVFESASEFSCGYANVVKDKTAGYINTKGEFIKTFDTSYTLSRFEDGFAVVSHYNAHTVYDTEFNEVFTKNGYTGFRYVNDGMFLGITYTDADVEVDFFDAEGNKIFSDKYISDNYIDGKVLSNSEEAIKLYDLNGEITVEMKREGDMWPHRYAENVNVIQTYENNTLIFTFLDDSFNEYGKLTEHRIYGMSDTFIMITTANGDKGYILKKLNREEEKKYTSSISSIADPEISVTKNTIEMKIGESRAFINGESRFIEEMYNFKDIAAIKADTPKIFIHNDRTMVPVRFLIRCFSEYGDGRYYINYNNEKREVTITDEKQIKLTIDSTDVQVTEFDYEKNDYVTKIIKTDIAPIIRNSRTYVPIRFVTEIMGYNVFYDNGYILITNEENAEFNSSEIADKFNDAIFTLQDYPIIDGSTATLPLSYALTSKILDVNEASAMSVTRHTKTENTYNRLINGEVDMLITGAPNAERTAKAAEVGVEFEYYNFAYDGFVFMINKDNPIENMSTQQIKDIYTGKITNWNEAGGNDAQIIPFQRNEDSGSQSLMRNLFMKGEKMIDPKTNQINAMGEIIDMVAEYDNAKDSIGYTVYYYLSEMHERDEVKVIGVDGVTPNDETIRSAQYPYIIKYAVVIRSDEPENSPVRKIIEFLKTDEGKELVKNAGFVSVE